MIDTTLVRDHYARMTDNELILLAQNEGQDLTSNALVLLHDEFVIRKLDTAIFNTVDENKIIRINHNIQQAQASASGEFVILLWKYILDAKELAITDGEIKKGIIERGLDETHAALMVQSIGDKAREVLHQLDSAMLRGGLICGVGLIITIWTYTSSINGGSYIITWGAIVFGGLRFLKSLSDKRKYKTILNNILAEQAAAITNE